MHGEMKSEKYILYNLGFSQARCAKSKRQSETTSIL